MPEPPPIAEVTYAPAPTTSASAADAFGPRRLGEHRGSSPGPTLVVIGALHGNEPAGPAALRAVLGRLERERPPFAGRLIGLVGNRRALAAGARYLGRDLNRSWSPEALAAVVAGGRASSPEDLELAELVAEVAPLVAEAREPVVFLDLHSTSAPGTPFVCMSDVLRNREIAFALPVPILLGIEEAIDGAFMGYFTELGHVAVAIEGGQHDDPATVDRLEAAIWLALVAAGALAGDDVPDLDACRSRLASAAEGLPRVLEVRERHPVHPMDGFQMKPGFRNLDPVTRGTLLAADVRGEIRARESGYLLMPLYQSQGSDGFFLARRVAPFWLRLSARLRRWRADRWLGALPGVRRDPEERDRLLVDPRVARFQTINLFHLLGYRRVRDRGELLVFSRRRPGYRGVAPIASGLAPADRPESVREP